MLKWSLSPDQVRLTNLTHGKGCFDSDGNRHVEILSLFNDLILTSVLGISLSNELILNFKTKILLRQEAFCSNNLPRQPS